jgi:hypothetical protein
LQPHAPNSRRVAIELIRGSSLMLVFRLKFNNILT